MSSTAPRTTAPNADASACSGSDPGSGSAEAIPSSKATAGQVGSAQAPPPARPVLYSFRRCPYAIRARLGLAAAGLRPGRDLELREVALQSKPPELLAASAKGTVPVLVLPAAGPGAGRAEQPPASPERPGAEPGSRPPRDAGGATGGVLDESLAILRWAIERRDAEGWLTGWSSAAIAGMDQLIAENDGPFKQHLDRFKYASRYGEPGDGQREHHRRQALAILGGWNRRLQAGGWLVGSRPSLADVALLPFVRQFRLADPTGFDAEPGLEALQDWLQRFLASAGLRQVMEAPWASRASWRSPDRLYHLALRQDWLAARELKSYRISTRGRSLGEVGFVHLSHAHQVEATAARFYGDLPAGELLLLTIDPERLRSEGLEVRLEPAPGSGELFPHLYGALPIAAVLLAERLASPEAPRGAEAPAA